MVNSKGEYARLTGARMRAARKARGLSVREVQEQSGGRFRVAVVGSWERADRRITAEKLAEYAAFLQVDMTVLLPPEPHREAQLLAYAAGVAERAVRDMTGVFGRMNEATAASYVAAALRAIAPPEVVLAEAEEPAA